MQGFVDRAAEGPQHRRTTDEAVIGTHTRPGDAPDPHSGEIIDAEIEEIKRARAVAGLEPRIRTDGGETPDAEPGPIGVGDHVQDHEDDSDKTMVVVRTPLESANETDARNGKTVAECNPEYLSDDDVVVVKYPKRVSTDLNPLQGFAFPRSRLEVTTRIHDRDGDDRGEE